jgi:hypothetical protein
MEQISLGRLALSTFAVVGIFVGGFYLAVKHYQHENPSSDPSYSDPITRAHYRAINAISAYQASHGVDPVELTVLTSMPGEKLVDTLAGLMPLNPDWTPDALITDLIHKSPQHYYNFKNGHEFGYTVGDGTGTVSFIHFQGKSADGVLHLRHIDSGMMVQMWCTDPCQLVTVQQTIFGGSIAPQQSVVNPQPGTVIAHMIRDMVDGKMDSDIVQ